MVTREARLVPAQPQHADALAADMREADVLEIDAVLGLGPLDVVRHSLAVSTLALTFLVGEDVAAMCGVVPFELPDSSVVGNLWMLSGHLVSRYRKAFLKASRLVVPLMLAAYPNGLCNHVDARYAGAIRLLERLGFCLGPAVPYGLRGELFHPFAMR